MNLVDWLGLTDRGKAIRDYRRGMTRAKKHDHVGAIEAYTVAIESARLPLDLTALAYFNRGLAYVMVGEEGKGSDDLGAVLAMEEVMVTVNVKTMARQKLAKMESLATQAKAHPREPIRHRSAKN